MTSPPSLAPRAAALDLIRLVVDQGQSLSESRAALPDSLQALPADQRARAQRLAQETFRQAGRADHLLRRALRKTPPDPVLWLMRLATVEMLALDAPAHGVINDAVTLARVGLAMPKLAGLVNAVLRQIAALGPQDWAATPVPRLPPWLRGALQNAYGNPATLAIEAAHQRPAPLDLTLKGACPDGLAGLALPTGGLRLFDAGQVSLLPGYAEGAWWVQDAAASLAARLPGDVSGLRVLDICAAPGGKTMQLAAAGAIVTALDISAPRLQRLHDNLARTGLSAQIVQADALVWRPEAPFDVIVLDAPCSATGTIRRHPELPLLRNREDVRALTRLQTRLLDHVLDPASGLLRAGGRLVYCTCSLLPEEGEDQIAAACARWSVRVVRPVLPGLAEDWLRPDGSLRTRPDYWPEIGGLDGFYMALLQHRP